MQDEVAINTAVVKETQYRSEKNAPSAALVPQQDQYSPRRLIGPFPIQEYGSPPEAGSEEEANGSNPPALPCATEGYSRNAAGVHGTELSKPKNTPSASVSNYLGR